MSSRKSVRGLSAICLALSLAACGVSDGGPIGTGLTASVVGNVVGATGAVEVSIDEVPGLAGRTDEEGNFELAGEFAGDLTLRFTTAEASRPIPVAVPAGSALALSDVELSAEGVEVQARLQLAFVGRAKDVDCDAGLLAVADASDAGSVFEVAIDEETQILRREGRAATCAQIGDDRRVTVEGLADPSGASRIRATRITIGQDGPVPIEPSYTIPLSGAVVAIDCAERTFALASDLGRSSVTLGAGTKITRRGGGEIDCADVEIGDQVVGLGVLRLAAPGFVRATDLVVVDERRPNLQLRFVGFIADLDCASGALRLRYQGAITRVRLTAATEVDPRRLTCADLGVGDRVSGVGLVREERPGEIEATRIRLRKRA